MFAPALRRSFSWSSMRSGPTITWIGTLVLTCAVRHRSAAATQCEAVSSVAHDRRSSSPCEPNAKTIEYAGAHDDTQREAGVGTAFRRPPAIACEQGGSASLLTGSGRTLLRTKDLLNVRKTRNATREGIGLSSIVVSGSGASHSGEGTHLHDDWQPALHMHRRAELLQ